MATVMMGFFRKPVPSERNGLRIYGKRGTLSADPWGISYDGWRYQEAIDAIRSNGGYSEVPR